MAERLSWGILATGSIARQFARGLKVSRTGTLVATGSRSREKADAFAAEHGGQGVEGYEAVLDDPRVQAVYVATPHHLHEEWTIRAARAGKAILCEKPFTLNALEAERALAAVRDAGVFFMEAFMYRVHPQTIRVQELLQEGAIGEPLVVNAEFGFQADRDGGTFRTDAAVGGGGLMDVGAYCVSFARMVAGEEPDDAHLAAFVGPRGYDEWATGTLRFPGGMSACFATGVHVNLRNDARIYGEAGSIRISSPWKCEPWSKVTLRRKGVEETLELGTDNDTLYAIEADTLAEWLEAGECPHMTPEDTLGNMRALDALRRSAGLTFAGESRA